MNIVLWIGDAPNQKALANKLHSILPIAGIVTETRKQKPRLSFSKITEKIIEKIFLNKISRSWFGLMNYYEKKYPDYPDTKFLNVENINSDLAYDFTDQLKPDLVVVSGTSLIRKKLLSLKPSIGIINLHTGLSPYIKGGPNCTNWCIATKQFHLIGNTVMWIDAGIDTGNIIATEFTSFTGSESLAEVHIKVMEHAHDLYIRSMQKLNSGMKTNVPQNNIDKGITYYTRQWRLKQKIGLVRNFKSFKKEINSSAYRERQQTIKLVSI